MNMKKIFAIIIFLIFNNIILSILALYAGLGRPLINLDYILILIFFVGCRNYIKPFLILSLYLVIYFIDVLLLAIQIFPFIRLTDILYLSNFVFNGPILYRIILISLLIYFVFNFFILRDFFYKKIKLSIKGFLSIFFVTLLLIFIKHLFNPIEKDSIYARFESSIYSSQLLFFLKHQNSSLVESVNGKVSELEPNRYNHATKSLFSNASNNNLSSKILLIVNESWGETNNKEHQDAILFSIYHAKDKLEYIHKGSFNFIGATVAGELRELCNLQPTTFNLKESNSQLYKDCLPNLLYKKGYETHAMHGAMSVMYDRKDWYPKAGFKNLYFYENLDTQSQCKSFSGRCDRDLIKYVKKLLLDHEKSFVYWLTLNTHAPYDDMVFIGDLNCQRLGVKDNTETCNNFRLQNQFFTSLSKLIYDPDMSGVEVYVVGDHSPPIFNLPDNFFSFKGSEIAWIHFKIK